MRTVKYLPVPRLKGEEQRYPDGANCPTLVRIYECLCKKGEIEYHRVPGFDDDYFVVKCTACDKRYRYICFSGPSTWEVYES
jgi:hypothetical protein